jgi:hapalindole-type alkaloid chlorinase
MFERWRRRPPAPLVDTDLEIRWYDIDVSEADREHETPVMFGTVLGRPLTQSGMSKDRTWHLDDAERYKPAYLDIFGIDPMARVGQVFSTMSGGLEMRPPTEEGRPYNPAQIRIMEPNGGGAPAHAGNEFVLSNKLGSADHLWTTTECLDHLSWYVMIRPSEGGGELKVYEELWAPTSDDPDQYIQPLTRDAEEFDRMPALTLVPGPGDLIVFRGGRRWHRVEEILGSVPRLTYGGFAAPSRDGTAIHSWG